MRRYRTSDHSELESWYVARGEAAPTPGLLPEFGLYVPGVAAGFLYRTDARDLCLLEGYVTNPRAGLRARHAALDQITGGLLEEAKALGCRHAIGFTSSHGAASLVRRRGLKDAGRYVMLRLTM